MVPLTLNLLCDNENTDAAHLLKLLITVFSQTCFLQPGCSDHSLQGDRLALCLDCMRICYDIEHNIGVLVIVMKWTLM